MAYEVVRMVHPLQLTELQIQQNDQSWRHHLGEVQLHESLFQLEYYEVAGYCQA